MIKLIKRILMLMGFFWLVTTVALMVLALSSKPDLEPNSVLVVRLDGELPERAEPGLDALLSSEPKLSFGATLSGIRDAARHPAIEGLVLRIGDPQLGAAQLQEFGQAMDAFRQNGKWSVSYLETAGEFSRGDAAYAVAVTADETVLSPPGEINLVGMRADVPFFAGTLDKLKIGVHVERRHEFKNAPNSFTERRLSATHREALAALVDDLQRTFIDDLAARRHVSRQVVIRWFQHGPYSAEEALKAGLVDRTGYMDQLLESLSARGANRDNMVPLATFRAATARSLDSGPTVGLITVSGPIVRGDNLDGNFDSQTTSGEITRALAQARKADVAGVVLRIDSPGGSYIASDLIRRELAVTRAKSIPVVASMANVAASGGYFVAMDANHIIAEPSTITGSIGVYGILPAFRRFFSDLLGVTFDGYQQTPHANAYSLLDGPSSARQDQLTEALDRIYADFVEKAAKARGQTTKQLDAVARGRVWSGKAALERGLVDSIGGMHEALQQVRALAKIPADAELTIKRFPYPDTPIAHLRALLTGAVQNSRALRTLVSQLAMLSRGEPTAVSLPPEFQVKP